VDAIIFVAALTDYDQNPRTKAATMTTQQNLHGRISRVFQGTMEPSSLQGCIYLSISKQKWIFLLLKKSSIVTFEHKLGFKIAATKQQRAFTWEYYTLSRNSQNVP
jgi:hypothetical protein